MLGDDSMEFVIIILLLVICYLLFDIRSRLPEKDYVNEALLRDKERKDKESQGNEFK
jgi:hypothetical protein